VDEYIYIFVLYVAKRMGLVAKRGLEVRRVWEKAYVYWRCAGCVNIHIHIGGAWSG